MAEVNVPPTPTVEEFNATGRTGRRNAMADILDSKHASVSTADLPFGMENLSCSDDKQNNGGSNTEQNGGASSGNS